MIFSKMIGELIFQFEQFSDDNYKVSTIKSYTKYEATSFLKPVGKQGIANLEKLLDNMLNEIDIQYLDKKILMTIPIPYIGENLIIALIQENIDDMIILRRRLDILEDKNKKMKIELAHILKTEFIHFNYSNLKCSNDEFYDKLMLYFNYSNLKYSNEEFHDKLMLKFDKDIEDILTVFRNIKIDDIIKFFNYEKYYEIISFVQRNDRLLFIEYKETSYKVEHSKWYHNDNIHNIITYDTNIPSGHCCTNPLYKTYLYN